MTEPNLEALLKHWAEHQALGDPGRDCPTISVLWLHAAENQPLDQHKAHVAGCSRCQRRLELIRQEAAAATSAVSKSSRVYRFRLWTGGLAAAACLMLLVLNWPTGKAGHNSWDREIAMLFDATAPGESGRLRGTEADRLDDATAPPDWLKSVLDDSGAIEAADALAGSDQLLMMELNANRLALQGHRLALSPTIDPKSKTGRELTDLLARDNERCNAIVDVLIRHLPDASESDRTELRNALDRWRVQNVLGR